MDPLTALGAAGSAIGIASFGIELFKILRTFVSQVISAQEQLEEVIAEIKSTASALEEIYNYLEKEVYNVEAGKPLELFTESSLIKVKDTADKCLVVFWRIEIAISGNEPDGFDDELRNRLNSFNQKLASYRRGQIIEIELQLNSGPLRFRDKFRWALQSSKLEKFCKGLQGHRNHLVLLLQIVLLGQRQAKHLTTKQDNVEIYTFLKIVTPEELRLMASEALEDGQRRRGRRPASSKIHWPSENSQIQSPTRQDSSNIIQLPELQEPWVHVHPQAKTYFASSDTKTRHIRTPSPPDRRLVMTPETVNGHTTSFRGGERQASDRLSISTAAGEYERTPKAEHTKHVLPNDPSNVVDDLMMSPKTEVDPDLLKATDVAVPKGVIGGRRPDAHLPQNRQTDPDHVNGFANPQQQKIANDDARKQPLDHSAQGRIATHNSIDNASVPPARTHRSVVTEEGNTRGRRAERSPSAISSSEHDISEKRALEPPDRESAVLEGQRSYIQNTIDGSEKEILPYVIQEEGAYRLSSSLLSKLDLKMELAFLSPGQLQTLRELLQYRKEDEPLKLVKIEVAKKPNRRFWKKQRHIMVAFVEGNVSDIPGVLLPQADMSKQQQMDDMTNLQRAQEVDQGRPPPRIGLPEFQDVTNDLSNTMHTPWSRASNGDWFTEYRVWHIEPYSAHDTGEESGNDWARSFLKEETLPRVEIKRRLRILDKDPATMIEKSAKLTNAQQFQVWRSIEAAKLGDPDPDYQWSLRQLEIIRTKRFFSVKQVKAIIVYVSKAPRLADRNTSDNAPKHDFIDALHRNDINTNNNATARRPMSSQDSSSSLSVESGAFPAAILSNRESIGQQVDGKRAEQMASRLEQNIIHANSSIASRPPIPRRQTLTSADKNSKLDHGLPRNYEKEREEELLRKIRRLELEIKHERELQKESEWGDRSMPEMQSIIGSGFRNEAGRAERVPLDAQYIPSPRESKIIVGDTEYTARGYGPRAHLQNRMDGSSQNRASVRFLERSRSNTPHQPTYDNDLKMEKSRARYPSQFDRRRFDPQSVAESQNAVKQLLLEWTPAHMRNDDKKDDKVSATYHERDFTSDTESEEYVMAEEQQEQAESSYSQSASKVADDPRKSKVEREGVHVMPSVANHAGGYPDSLNQGKEKVAHGDVVLQDWGTLGNRTGGISSSPQQLSRPSSQNVNDANRADEKPQRDIPQTRTLPEGSPTQKTNNDIHLFNGAKTIARASTLPQTSRQPWSDEDWARQIVEETAGTAEDETRLDRLRERRASFHSPVSRSLGREVRTSRQRNSSDVPTEPVRVKQHFF